MTVIQKKQDNDTHTHTHRGDWHKMSETESEKKNPGFHKCAILSESNGKSIFDLILYSSSMKKRTTNKFNHIHLQCFAILFGSVFYLGALSLQCGLVWNGL